MVPVLSLWLPILVSAAIVFMASSIIHMMLPFHKNDIRKLQKEDEALAGEPEFAPYGLDAAPVVGGTGVQKLLVSARHQRFAAQRAIQIVIVAHWVPS